MKKFFILVLCLLVSGCRATVEEVALVTSKEQPRYLMDEEETTLSWYINYSWFNMQWGNNLVSKKIKADTNIDIDFIVPSGSESNTLEVMLASNQLPDLLTLGWWEPEVAALIDGGYVQALNMLADAYDPYFYKVSSDKSIEWYTQEDGNIYGYPNSSYAPQDYEEKENIVSNQTFLVRKDLYEAIGSPNMSTPEGFKQAMMAAKAYDPSISVLGLHEFGEKGNDSLDHMLMNFLALPFEKEGEYYDRYSDPDYLEWLNVLRELYVEGYLGDELFFDKRVQTNEKIADGEYFALLYQYIDMDDQQNILYSNGENQHYIAIDGPKNHRQEDHVLPGGSIQGWTLTFISKDCQQPERAIALMTYLLSDEGQRTTYLGEEGVTYALVNDQVLFRDEFIDLYLNDRTKFNDVFGANYGFWMLQDNLNVSKYKLPTAKHIEQIEAWTYPYSTYLSHYDVTFDYQSKEAMISNKIDYLWGDTLPKLISAPTLQDFIAIFTQFVEQREAIGFEEFKVAYMKNLQEVKQRLGITDEK